MAHFNGEDLWRKGEWQILTAEMDSGKVTADFNGGNGRRKGERQILTAELDGRF